jgi:transketolase
MNKFEQYLEEVQHKKHKIYNEAIDPLAVLTSLGFIGTIVASMAPNIYNTWKNNAKEKERIEKTIKILDEQTLEISKKVFNKIFKKELEKELEKEVTNWEDIDKNSSGKKPEKIMLFQKIVAKIVAEKIKKGLSEIDPKTDISIAYLKNEVLNYIKTKAKRAGREYEKTPKGIVRVPPKY